MEKKYRIINGQIFQEQGSFLEGDLFLLGERIAAKKEYQESDGGEVLLDASGLYVIPGLTDIHFHGCMGSDCCDGTPEAFRTIARYELSQGVTSITPATMTMPGEVLEQICRTAADFSCPDGADFCGLYMEGPFISPAKKGAQNERYICPPDTNMLRHLQALSRGKIRTVTVAPEIPGAMDFIRQNHGNIRISLAHTAADYDTADEAFRSGASQLTHMFNAMPPFGHRAPGPVGAAADHESCMAELICDGIHVHPAAVRTAFKIFGDDRIIMISDSMRAAGMPDGQYDLGGQNVTVQGRLALLADGTIAGSVTSLMGCLRTAVQEMGIPLASAVKCAAVNPAKAAGLAGCCGTLRPGRYANIVFLDQDLQIKRIIHRGTPLKTES